LPSRRSAISSTERSPRLKISNSPVPACQDHTGFTIKFSIARGKRLGFFFEHFSEYHCLIVLFVFGAENESKLSLVRQVQEFIEQGFGLRLFQLGTITLAKLDPSFWIMTEEVPEFVAGCNSRIHFSMFATL
jgi:hypothetical protein